jgi:hypothetical protein
MLIPIWPVLIAESLSNTLVACLDICLETEQELNAIVQPANKNVIEKKVWLLKRLLLLREATFKIWLNFMKMKMIWQVAFLVPCLSTEDSQNWH